MNAIFKITLRLLSLFSFNEGFLKNKWVSPSALLNITQMLQLLTKPALPPFVMTMEWTVAEEDKRSFRPWLMFTRFPSSCPGCQGFSSGSKWGQGGNIPVGTHKGNMDFSIWYMEQKSMKLRGQWNHFWSCWVRKQRENEKLGWGQR